MKINNRSQQSYYYIMFYYQIINWVIYFMLYGQLILNIFYRQLIIALLTTEFKMNRKQLILMKTSILHSIQKISGNGNNISQNMGYSFKFSFLSFIHWKRVSQNSGLIKMYSSKKRNQNIFIVHIFIHLSYSPDNAVKCETGRPFN